METVMPALSRHNQGFTRMVTDRLSRRMDATFGFNTNGDLRHISAVLFLLGKGPDGSPWLILNKRSPHVRQPGDLCCPGGGISPAVDRLLARCLRLPATPLSRWTQTKRWQRNRRDDWLKLSLLLATGLREGAEEMRLNPFGVRFLGPMPAQHLVMFKRAIYPLVAWVTRQQRFQPNWEVSEIIRIPLKSLLVPGNYARYRITFAAEMSVSSGIAHRDMPCFIHRHDSGQELLWGATYRITEQFIKMVFDYDPPALASLPAIHRELDQSYLEGAAPSRPRPQTPTHCQQS
jgi:hypothetical protein